MSLVGKVMVFKGGSFSGHKRDFAAAVAMPTFGVKVEASVTRATDILVCGSGVGAKTIEDAKKKSIEVWTADDFWVNYQKPEYAAETVVDASRGEKPSDGEAASGNATGSGASGRGGKAAGSRPSAPRKQKAAAAAAGDETPAKAAKRSGTK